MLHNFVSFSEFQSRTAGINQPQNNVQVNVQQQSVALQDAKDEVQLTKNIKSDDNAKLQNDSEVKKYFDKAKKQNGLIEKFADKIKGITGIGLSSKKLEETLKENISDEEKYAKIDKYKDSNENTAHAVVDVASSAASLAVFFKAKQAIQTNLAKLRINNWKPESIKAFFGKAGNLKVEKLINFAEKSIDKKYAFIIPAMILAGVAGGIVKNVIFKANRIGTSQYKPIYDENMDKAEKKQAKKIAKKEKRSANFRNFASGFVNGIAAPIMTLGALATPLYLAVNSLSRYFIATKEDKGKKSFKSYIENLKATPLTYVLSAVAIAIPAIKKGNFSVAFDKNIEKVVNNLKDAALEEKLKSKTSYQELEEIMYSNENVQKIMNGSKYSEVELDESEKLKLQIEELIDENIFAVKFKQINPENDALTKALKEKCPSTWGNEAQSIIDNAFGKGKYTIQSSLGAGTVAETYIVKDEKGEEYCIKMLKKGMTQEKILRDKNAFIELIKNAPNKTDDEKEFLIKNLESIADGILQEIDLKNEMKAADELRKVTSKANVVQGIEVRDNIYVMKKADGVSLKTLSDYIGFDPEYARKRIGELEKEIKNLKEDNYWFKDILESQLAQYKFNLENCESLEKEIGTVTKEEAKALMEQYEDVLIEQFSKVDSTGKIIHGDIHSGNIFVDMKTLRENLQGELSRKAKRISGVHNSKPALTLIDTGNTINQTSEQAFRFKNLTSYIQNGDWENITTFVLEGAKLPEGMSQEKAFEQISKELQQAFFDNKTYTGPITNDTILAITDSIMQKLGIIPASTQGALSKTKNSADTSMVEFKSAFLKKLSEKLNEKMEQLDSLDIETFNEMNKVQQAANISRMTAEIMPQLAKTAGEMGESELEYMALKKLQERKNLASLTPSERLKLKRSKSTPDKNSEEFLTYVFRKIGIKFIKKYNII